MDDVDRDLLNIIQTEFPVEACPYRVLGERLGITEDEAFGRVRALVESGIIRRIGPTFETGKLGHASALVAAKVPAERLKEVADIVSSFAEVTHNYGRDFEYNLWFTLVCEDEPAIKSILGKIKLRTGVSEMHLLSAEKLFKIKVEFKF
ncbi:MAG: siroheme decarboxylase subunit alpha [Armatimonadota bacterium]